MKKPATRSGCGGCAPSTQTATAKAPCVYKAVLVNDARLIKLFCVDHLTLDHGAECIVNTSPALEREYHKHFKIVSSHEPVERLSGTDTFWGLEASPKYIFCAMVNNTT